MKLDQISFEELLVESRPQSSKIKPKRKKIYSLSELAAQGKNFCAEEERRWTEAVFELQRQERSNDNWLDWFQCCELFRKEMSILDHSILRYVL
jgi:hypothetical protein